MNRPVTVWIYAPPDEPPHWRCFDEVARGMVYAFKQIVGTSGLIASSTVPDLPSHRLLVFNAHRLPPEAKLPGDAIIYNAEQVPCGIFEGKGAASSVVSPWVGYLHRLRCHTSWDYAETNIARLRAYDVSSAHCPVGAWPGLSNIETIAEDIDVLFIGSLSDRRNALLKAIADRRLGMTGRRVEVKTLFGVYGAERDQAIARAKLVLNVHFYPEPIFEIFRVSHLLANRKCVVSEDGGVDPALESLAATATAYYPYHQIAEATLGLLKDRERRQDIAGRGFRALLKIDQTAAVRRVLEVTA